VTIFPTRCNTRHHEQQPAVAGDPSVDGRAFVLGKSQSINCGSVRAGPERGRAALAQKNPSTTKKRPLSHLRHGAETRPVKWNQHPGRKPLCPDGPCAAIMVTKMMRAPGPETTLLLCAHETLCQ